MHLTIGITDTEIRYPNYPAWIKGDNVNLEIIRLTPANTGDFKKCDGFVLSGGVDTHPNFYKNNRINYPFAPDKFNEVRDKFEMNVFNYAQEKNIPVLAVCRGMQLVNIALGGDLIQDIEESGKQNHRKLGDADGMHEITVIKDSLLYETIGVENCIINSAHHQALGKIASGLKITAFSPDGIAEAVEWENKKDKSFLLCVQFHPERLAQQTEGNVLANNIRKEFLKAINKKKTKILISKSIMNIINPATEEIITKLEEDNIESLERKFELLRKGQETWNQVLLNDRIVILQKFSELLKETIEQGAATLTSEVGKPLQQARNEINGACNRIKWLTENAGKYLADDYMTIEKGLTEKIVYEPLGVVCNISAWNYPYLVGVNVFIPALLSGNSVMYKPSEFSSLTGLRIEMLLKKAGVPDNAFQIAIGAREVGEALLHLPFNGYFFTGSYKTGQFIYEKTAHKMVPCQLELGGKDPLYVADDIVDIKNTAAGTADGAFYNAGQSCCAVERIYVQEKVYDQYVEEFIKEVKGFKTGLPTIEGTYIGPLTRKAQLDIVESQVNEAIIKGAKVMVGGKRIAGKGYFFEPTVLVNVNHDMSVMREESFGPVIGIMKVKDDTEAVKLMQDTEYGLTAAVYSTSKERAEKILSKINAGTGYWNCCDRVSAALPWSGRKHSGIGTTLSHTGLRAFTNPKAYHLKG